MNFCFPLKHQSGQNLDFAFSNRNINRFTLWFRLLLPGIVGNVFENTVNVAFVAIWSTIQFSGDSMKRKITKISMSFLVRFILCILFVLSLFLFCISLIFNRLWFLKKKYIVKKFSCSNQSIDGHLTGFELCMRISIHIWPNRIYTHTQYNVILSMIEAIVCNFLWLCFNFWYRPQINQFYKLSIERSLKVWFIHSFGPGTIKTSTSSSSV